MNLTSAYQDMAKSGDLRLDPQQLTVLDALQDIRRQLESAEQRRNHRLSRIFQSQETSDARGYYLWGPVGTGKSMLMDLFFNATTIARKRRVHFHAFVQEIHNLIFAARQSEAGDPIKVVADNIIRRSRLLCLDEMQISDITDAMIMGRLFMALIEGGVTIVTTSNRPPVDLYKDGLNRQLFLPFITLMQAQMDVHQLLSATDYRQEKMRGKPTYFFPLNAVASLRMDQIWQDLTGEHPAPHTLHVKGREVVLPLFYNGVARASFVDLCENSLGAADYLALAAAVRVLVLDNIPRLSRANNNEAKRFVILIDTLYEAKIQLICSAATEPEKLFQSGDGSFEFARTASRLREMQGADWAS